MTEQLHLTPQTADGPFTLATVSGQLDLHTAPTLRDKSLELIEQRRPHTHLILDMAGVTFCDSAGLSALIGIWHAAKGAGGSLTLAAIPERLARVLTMTGVDTFLPVHPTAAAALAAHQDAAPTGERPLRQN